MLHFRLLFKRRFSRKMSMAVLVV